MLNIETMRLELERPREWCELLEENEGDESVLPTKEKMRELIIEELVEVICPSGNIQHQRKILIDLINRERKASTALGHGIAVPHVRTIHARDLTLGFARTSHPVDWDSPDGEPVDLFFIMVSPPYDDRIYTKIWSKLAEVLSFEDTRQRLRDASGQGEVLRILKDI